MNRKDYTYFLMTVFWIAMLFVSFHLGKASMQQRNDGLHKQLTRTQYQLKKAKKQNVEQTARIAELTGNGG